MNDVVLKVFAGLIRAWEIQIGVDTLSLPNHLFFKEVDAKYVPLVDGLFFAKETK